MRLRLSELACHIRNGPVCPTTCLGRRSAAVFAVHASAFDHRESFPLLKLKVKEARSERRRSCREKGFARPTTCVEALEAQKLEL